MVFGSVVTIVFEDHYQGQGHCPFFIMKFLPGTDILVTKMPPDVFADLQEASNIGIEQKIKLNDKEEASIRQEYGMPVPEIFEDWITQLIDHCYEFHKSKYGIVTEGAQNLHIVKMWVNIMEKGDQHYPHTHEHSFYSFSCYISSTNDDAPFYFIKDNKGQKIEINKDSEGHALVFPSTMIHTVYPKKTEGQRVSVSGNIVIRP